MTALMHDVADATASLVDAVPDNLVEVTAMDGAEPVTGSTSESDKGAVAKPTAAQDAVAAVITVLRGAPTEEELAAIVAVLAASGGADTSAPRRPDETWGHPTLLHRNASTLSPSAFAVDPILRS